MDSLFRKCCHPPKNLKNFLAQLVAQRRMIIQAGTDRIDSQLWHTRTIDPRTFDHSRQWHFG